MLRARAAGNRRTALCFAREVRDMDDGKLPQDVAQGLDAFVASAKEVLEGDLAAIILFGSAAEGRMRATSDVNVLVALKRFDKARIDRLREPMRLAHAVIRLEAMFILESELSDAAEAFAVKFADIRARHRVLAGSDLTQALQPSRAAMLTRLRQILLNYTLRTRERYVLVSLREEQLAPLLADSAGPLRSAAEIILQLEGRPAASPKEALEALARELDGERWNEALARLSDARAEGELAAGAGALAERLRGRAAQIAP
jgi:predicted nucleotidyltransferase